MMVAWAWHETDSIVQRGTASGNGRISYCKGGNAPMRGRGGGRGLMVIRNPRLVS